jgi:hypothetical protein
MADSRNFRSRLSPVSFRGTPQIPGTVQNVEKPNLFQNESLQCSQTPSNSSAYSALLYFSSALTYTVSVQILDSLRHLKCLGFAGTACDLLGIRSYPLLFSRWPLPCRISWMCPYHTLARMSISAQGC